MAREYIPRRFSDEELYEVEEDARSSLLNEEGALSDPGRHLGDKIDLARYCRSLHEELRRERDRRLHG